MDIFHVILVVNGFYDIVCACSILWLWRFPFFSYLSTLHASMFRDDKHVNNPVIRRLLSYWLLTYGLVRIVAGFQGNDVIDILGASTYFIECFCFEYECRVGKTMVHSKVTFVSFLSLTFGIFIVSNHMAVLCSALPSAAWT